MNNYQPNEIKLANEIADTLKDPEALPIYLEFARIYKEDFLRKRLKRVMSVEESKIRKTRGALFTFLVNQPSNDSRN